MHAETHRSSTLRHQRDLFLDEDRMNYTESLDHVIHGPTGQPMHTDSAAINTVQSAKDTNMGIWSLMELIKAAGLQGRTFNPDDPESYKLLKTALDSVYAKLNSPGFTGKPTAPTPERFDNSTKLATTEWANNAGVQFSPKTRYINGTSLTLMVDDVGSRIFFNGGTNQSVVLPATNGLPIGSSIYFGKNSNGTSLSVTAAGGASIIDTNGSALVNFLNVMGGEDAFVTWSGTAWMCSGTAIFRLNQFATGNTWMTLPNGWRILASGSFNIRSSLSSVTFPIAFPNAARAVVPQLVENSGSSYPTSVIATSISKTGYNLRLIADGNIDAYLNYIAIGY
ncbi:hypothetical protein ACIPF8_21145 [Collimonas sp. NPDC087041]|uniref:gp53-like domain-containing protein n=1 Tax=Collimonas sp. NPDC087041 TaxID=3363960 RepID=UPI0037F6CC2A